MHPRIVGRPSRRTPVGSTSLMRYDPGAMRQPAKNHSCEKFAIAGARSPARESRALPGRDRAFTLIELLVVIAIIAILIGLFFPAFSAVQNQARKTQAKNDLTQIVTAVNAFYTEYGKYPLPAGTITDRTYGPAGGSNADLFYTLRAVALGANLNNAINTRQIVYLSPKSGQRGGIATQAATINGISVAIGDFVDPWGIPYNIAIDGNYNNIAVAPAYTDLQVNYVTATDGSGDVGVRLGVLGWSYGKDQARAASFTGSDDVISWQ